MNNNLKWSLRYLTVAAALMLCGCAGQPIVVDSEPVSQSQIVEASCGQCQFDMEGTGCDLAVRIGDKSYYVDGFGIDDFGDAHGPDGFCNAVRRAKVVGKVENGRFVATQFEMMPKAN